MTVSISGTNGVTFPDSSLQAAAASPYVLKNRIINGAFDVWQRGTSITGSNAGSSASYWADRWCFYRATSPTASTLSQQTTSPPTGFKNFARIQRNVSNTSTDGIYINQSEEILNSYDLAGQTVTLSFWAKAGVNYSSASSLLNVVVTTGTGSTDNNSLWNVWTGATNPVNTTATLTTSWQRFTFTGSVGSSVTQIAAQFHFIPVGTAGAADYFDITGVQLELGSTATPFERRLYNQELANCQRYYYRNIANAAYSILSSTAIGGSGTICDVLIQAPVTMRTYPTTLETSNIALQDTVTLYSSGTWTINTSLYSNQIPSVRYTHGSSALTQYRPYYISANNNSAAYLGLGAEL